VSESQVDDYTQVQAYRNEPFKICTKRDNLPNDSPRRPLVDVMVVLLLYVSGLRVIREYPMRQEWGERERLTFDADE
jgi:hypothetical protein